MIVVSQVSAHPLRYLGETSYIMQAELIVNFYVPVDVYVCETLWCKFNVQYTCNCHVIYRKSQILHIKNISCDIFDFQINNPVPH